MLDNNLIILYLVGIFSILAMSFIMFKVFVLRENKYFSRVLYIMLFLSIYMLLAQYFKYLNLYFYIDFSSWTHLLNSIISTGKPLSLNEDFLHPGSLNYLSVHFVPLIYLFAIPFKLWPHSETMIILNYFLMLSSVIPLYKIAYLNSRNKQFGLFMAVLLAWYPTFQYTTLYEFDMLRFSIPIILWLLYFYEKERFFLFYLFVLIAVCIREELGLTIFLLGIYLFFIKKDRLKGLITILIGIGAFMVITQIIMPNLKAGTGIECNFVSIKSFSNFGNSPIEIIKKIIMHPIFSLKEIFQPIKLANLSMLFIPLLCIPLLSPTILISILANVGIGLLSGSPVHFSYLAHYLSPSIPFILLAFIKAWPKLLKQVTRFTTDKRIFAKANINSAVMISVFSGLLTSNMFFGPSPISLQFWFKDVGPAHFKTQNFHYSAYKITEHSKNVEALCNLIPDSSIISAHHFLFPRLFKKKGTMIYPQLESSNNIIHSDYVFFDKTNNNLKKESPAFLSQKDFDIVEQNKNEWQLIASEDGYCLYKRKNKF